jgi:hypothetical protein
LYSKANDDFREGKPRFYIDAIVGLGGTPIESSSFVDDKKTNYLNFTIHPSYYLSKRIEIESGFGFNSFGYYYPDTNDGVRAKYFEIPLMIRTYITKHFSIAAGPAYNLLRNANAFSGQGDEFDVDITDKMKKGFACATIDTRLGEDLLYIGLNYTQGLQPIQTVDDTWKAWTLRFYLGVNISEIVKYKLLGIR